MSSVPTVFGTFRGTDSTTQDFFQSSFGEPIE